MSFIDNIRALGRRGQIFLGLALVAMVAGILLVTSIITKPEFRTLYSGLSLSEASDIVRTLEQAGIQTKVSADGSIVYVPMDEFPRAGMALADNGLLSNGAPGYELFDNGGGVGMNTFEQKVKRLRALQGELSKSIQTISGVDYAKVLLVLPEREAFSRETPNPSASVVVRTTANFELEKRQANAIRHLVAAAVPNLTANRVTITTTDGIVIAGEDGGSASGEAGIQSKEEVQEDRYARAITDILTARVGAGNVRVKVAVDLTNERKVVVSEDYNPDQQVVRSTQTRTENEENIDGSGDNVSVATNLPENQFDTNLGGTTSTSKRQKTEEQINYEIGLTRTETIYEPGEVEKVSVAVLVNGIFERNDSGDVEYKERPQEEIARLEELVKTAIGFDESRGDSVSVDSLRFVDYSLEIGEPVASTIMDKITENIMTIIKWLFVLIAVALFLTLGFKPLVSQLAGSNTVPADDEEGDIDSVQDATPEGPEAATATADAGAQKNEPEELIGISSVDGGVRKRKLAQIADMVRNDQDEAVKILRAWISMEN